uniref:Uncharacterized protein n=1 Tax=viral metagenome TaxID=1070528 RepID=A0A6C0CZ22_9ZZZZ
MSNFKHEEWDAENSLTSPEDRNREKQWRPDQRSPPLTETEVDAALTELNNSAFVKKFPRVDRTYADPPLPLQTIGLVSFTPAKGAQPNENGVYGFAKLRGNFATMLEADQRAEYLIRNADSYHSIYHTYVGRPFPLTVSSKYSAETAEVDIRTETTKSVSQNIKNKKDEEQRIVNEIKEKEERLLEETRSAEEKGEDPYEHYVTLRVKKAQLTWTYLEHIKKMAEVKKILIRTRKEVADMDAENETYKESYFEKYMKARADAGVKESAEELQDNFIKYLVEDVKLDFDE